MVSSQVLLRENWSLCTLPFQQGAAKKRRLSPFLRPHMSPSAVRQSPFFLLLRGPSHLGSLKKAGVVLKEPGQVCAGYCKVGQDRDRTQGGSLSPEGWMLGKQYTFPNPRLIEDPRANEGASELPWPSCLSAGPQLGQCGQLLRVTNPD